MASKGGTGSVVASSSEKKGEALRSESDMRVVGEPSLET